MKRLLLSLLLAMALLGTTTGSVFAATDPTGVGAASPSVVFAGDSTLLTVTVTPGNSPPSTGLTVASDLSSIGGSATRAFSDDGTNGDVTPGDNIFSFFSTVAAATTPGAKTIPVTIGDAQGRSASGSISLTIYSPVATSSATPSNATPSIGNQIVVTINIDVSGVNSPNNSLGSFTGTLDWNPAVLAYHSNSGMLGGFTGAINITNVSTGHIVFNGTNVSGATGNTIVLNITFDAVGSGSSALDLTYSAMAAASTFESLLSILTVNDGLVNVYYPGCVCTQGYWKTHSKYGPAPYDPTWDLKAGGDEPFLSSAWNTGFTWYSIMQEPPKKGNAYIQLAQQYVAAWLNINNVDPEKAADPTLLYTSMDDAEVLLGQYMPTYNSKTDPDGVRDEFLMLADKLGQFNEGLLGVQHCE